MRWENIRGLFGVDSPSLRNEVTPIDARPLSEREAGWIRDILQVNPEWRDADIERTTVVAEGANAEGFSIVLDAPGPENPRSVSQRETVGQIWIETDDGGVINVQLSQFKGQLQQIYVLYIDSKRKNRPLPARWYEASREVVNL